MRKDGYYRITTLVGTRASHIRTTIWKKVGLRWYIWLGNIVQWSDNRCSEDLMLTREKHNIYKITEINNRQFNFYRAIL